MRRRDDDAILFPFIPMSVAARSWMHSAPLVVTLIAAPALVPAQGRPRTRRVEPVQVDSVIVTAPGVRIRSGPAADALSIETLPEGIALPLAAVGGVPRDWVAVTLDDRVAFLPRYAVVIRERRIAAVGPSETEAAPRAAPAERVADAAPVPAPAVAPAVQAHAAAQPVVAAAPAAASRPAIASQPGTAVATRPAVASQPATAVATRPAVVAQPAAVPRAAVAARPTTPAPPAAAPPPAIATQSATAPQPSELPAPRTAGPPLGLNVGLLASVTRLDQAGTTPARHVLGLPFLGVTYGGWGLYGASEFGNDGLYRTTAFGGGLSRDLLDLHMLRVTALGGYTAYTATPATINPTSPPTTASLRGASVGGMASVPLLGPVRLAYRGQYITGQSNGATVHLVRNGFGLLF